VSRRIDIPQRIVQDSGIAVERLRVLWSHRGARRRRGIPPCRCCTGAAARDGSVLLWFIATAALRPRLLRHRVVRRSGRCAPAPGTMLSGALQCVRRLVRSGARTLVQLGAMGCQRQSKLPLEHFWANDCARISLYQSERDWPIPEIDGCHL
jgi:hypothetical protein